MLPTPDVLERWQGQPAVPLPEVTHAVGLNYDHGKAFVQQGLVKPLPERGFGNAHMIDWDQVLLILAAAAFAAVAGMAVVTALRTLRQTGAQVTPGGITIPVALPNISP